MKVHESPSKSAWCLLSVAVLVAVVVSGCASARALTRSPGAAPEDEAGVYESAAQQNTMAVETVESFYDWYLSYPGNVAAEGAYRSSEYLTLSFVEKVDEILASFDRGGYDPFLCAQDIPGHLVVGDEVARSGDVATIVVYEVWNPGMESEVTHEVVVELEMTDGEWKISNILCK